MKSERTTKQLLWSITETIKYKCTKILETEKTQDPDDILLQLNIIKDLTNLAEKFVLAEK